jgi:hypothetical protein
MKRENEKYAMKMQNNFGAIQMTNFSFFRNKNLVNKKL